MNFRLRVRPKLIEKYLFKQVLFTTLMAMTLFTIIWIAPEILFDVIKRVIAQEYSISTGLQVLVYQIPMVLGKAIPMGLLLGCLAVFDKMSKDFELTVLRSVGVSFRRLLAPVLFISIIFSALCFFTFDILIPKSRNALIDIKGIFVANQFVYLQKDESDKPKKVVVVSKFDGDKIYNVNVLNFARNNDIDAPLMSNIYTAPFAIYDNDAWYLVDGMDYKLNSDNVYKDIKHFDAIKILSGKTAKNAYNLMKYSSKRARTYTNAELWNYISLLKEEKMTEEYRFHLNKYYQRFFQSLSCVFLAICGCILGYSRPRETRFLGLTTAVGVIFAYYIIVPLLDLLAQKGVLFPMLAAAIPCLLVIATIVGVIKHKNFSMGA